MLLVDEEDLGDSAATRMDMLKTCTLLSRSPAHSLIPVHVTEPHCVRLILMLHRARA